MLSGAQTGGRGMSDRLCRVIRWPVIFGLTYAIVIAIGYLLTGKAHWLEAAGLTVFGVAMETMANIVAPGSRERAMKKWGGWGQRMAERMRGRRPPENPE